MYDPAEVRERAERVAAVGLRATERHVHRIQTDVRPETAVDLHTAAADLYLLADIIDAVGEDMDYLAHRAVTMPTSDALRPILIDLVNALVRSSSR